jgi:hypothetical protein
LKKPRLSSHKLKLWIKLQIVKEQEKRIDFILNPCSVFELN